MRKVLLAVGAMAIVALATVAVAGARGPDNSFAVGSGKVEAFVGLEHLALSAHNAPGPELCSATGHLTYSNPGVSYSAEIKGLRIFPLAGGNGEGGLAFISAIVTSSSSGFRVPVGSAVYFDVADLTPDGTADQIRSYPPDPLGRTLCSIPIGGEPITSGNIVIHAETAIG
jgi:hypothetical protein